ncbi:hypothetical protein P692DRAFT_20831336 [Suillus brevipes Sb2]|nr:hypothetical protein P692DRAFT_20831336 [Suillus brevipes Sb2]
MVILYQFLVTLPTIAARGIIVTVFSLFPFCFVYMPIIKEQRICFSNLRRCLASRGRAQLRTSAP